MILEVARLEQIVWFRVKVIGVNCSNYQAGKRGVVSMLKPGKPEFIRSKRGFMRVSLKQGFIFDVGVVDDGMPALMLKRVVVEDVKPELMQVSFKRVVVFGVGVLDDGKPAVLRANLKWGLWLSLQRYTW